MAGGAKGTTAAMAGLLAQKSTMAPRNFKTQRMVKEYTEQLYIPAAKSYENFSRDGCGAATHLSQWKTQIRKDWPEVKISDVQIGNKDRSEERRVGKSV